MNRTLDTRILVIGLVVVCGLLARPFDRPRYDVETTGSVPAATATLPR